MEATHTWTVPDAMVTVHRNKENKVASLNIRIADLESQMEIQKKQIKALAHLI